MSDQITIPSPVQLSEEIRARREELAALKKLYKIAQAAAKAGEAAATRKAVARRVRSAGGPGDVA